MKIFYFTLFALCLLSFSCTSESEPSSLPKEEINFNSEEVIDLDSGITLEILPMYSNEDIFIDQLRYMITTGEYLLF